MTGYFFYIQTPLNKMISMVYDNSIVFLDFVNDKSLRQSINHVILNTATDKNNFKEEKVPLIKMLQEQINEYFYDGRTYFNLPYKTIGTEFQKRTWEYINKIPYGETRTYKQQADNVLNTKCARAVANANGKNKLVLLIPCHRVIRSDKTIGGYGSGIYFKEYLLSLEKQNIK